MVHGENSTVVQYELKKNNHPERLKNLRLELRPLIAFRDYHSTTHENGAINPAVEERPGLARVTPYEDCLRFIWPTMLSNCGRRATGTGTSNMTSNANAGSISLKTYSIRWSLRFDLACVAQASVIASTERRDVAQVGRVSAGRDHASPEDSRIVAG